MNNLLVNKKKRCIDILSGFYIVIVLYLDFNFMWKEFLKIVLIFLVMVIVFVLFVIFGFMIYKNM